MNPHALITRRNAIIAGAAALGGFLLLPRRKVELPPTYGRLLRMGDVFTYNAQRRLFSGRALAKEYSHNDISSFPGTGMCNPAEIKDDKKGETYRRLEAGGFADWKISVEGLVAKPGNFSLADLKRFPSRTQITRHTCEEGWSAIGEWTGAPLSRVLEAAGMLPTARIVNFHSFDGWLDGIDMLDALHPQTMLAYGMNGRDIPIQHGAPVRLRVETQLGYRSIKYITRIVVTDSLSYLEKAGVFKSDWSWYAGI
jgi:DMSO/TMAO reductase YedYZ molybdopterin-dependent catalytic subunit